jgi:hypothetical protein
MTTLRRAKLRLSRLGYEAEVVRRIQVQNAARRRHRPFAFLDLLGLRPGQPLFGVYLADSLDAAYHAAQELAALPAVRAWLVSCRLQVWALDNGSPGRWRTWYEFDVGETKAGIRASPP